jgi:hypothetical protein
LGKCILLTAAGASDSELVKILLFNYHEKETDSGSKQKQVRSDGPTGGSGSSI